MPVMRSFAKATFVSAVVAAAFHAVGPTRATSEQIHAIRGGTATYFKAKLGTCPSSCESGTHVEKCCPEGAEGDKCEKNTSKPCGAANNCGTYNGGTWVREAFGTC